MNAADTDADRRRRDGSSFLTRVYEQERRRLSHDLHDDVGHDLMLIKLYLEMMALEQSDSRSSRPRLVEAIALVSHAIDSIRRLVYDLGPSVFEDQGFLPAVKSYVNQFSRRTKIAVHLHAAELPEHMPSTHQIALYRLIQGALSNVFKHAAATRVRISLASMKASVLVMVIEDDGVGFDTQSKLRSECYGLTAMRERVEVLGGKFHIQSNPANPGAKAHGTRIEIDLPLAGAEEGS